MAKLRGIATELIPFGEHVLCRNNEVSRASPKVANGTADTPPSWKWEFRRGSYQKGDFLMVTPIEGLGQRDLKAMAEGPIMEPIRIYLPAGKLTEAEYQERLDLDFKRAGIDRT